MRLSVPEVLTFVEVEGMNGVIRQINKFLYPHFHLIQLLEHNAEDRFRVRHVLLSQDGGPSILLQHYPDIFQLVQIK